MRKMILWAVAVLAAASCTRGLDEAAVRGGDGIRFVVGDFPAFGGASTRTVGTEDPGKASWAKGDELLLEMTSKTLGTKYATFTYNGSEWELTDGELAYKEDEYPTFPHVYYAPNYKWEAGELTLKEGKVAGTDEYIEGTAQITPNGEAITVDFSTATRKYSRLRIATIPDADIVVEVQNFKPAGSSKYEDRTYTLHSDANGNAYLYGIFGNNSTVSVKKDNVVLADYSFTQATASGKSYALDATVISLEGMSLEEIGAAVSNIASEVDAGKTRFNIRLAAEPDSDVFDSIKGGLAEAGDATINLTLIGCTKIPSSAFQYWTMLKSLSLPDVSEIGEEAFYGCEWLQKVVFGTPLTKVYGDPSETNGGGIFEWCSPDFIDLVLSGEQNMMALELVEGEFVQIAQDGMPYKGTSDHKNSKFIGYTFRSVTFGGKTY